jgi:ATP-binding cassette subfamily C (CFTR/MRP) protein 4
MMCTKRI